MSGANGSLLTVHIHLRAFLSWTDMSETRSVTLANQHHRTVMSMPSKHKIVTNRKQHHRAVNQTAPVHARRLHRRRQREESKDVDQQEKQYRDDIAGEPCAT